MTILYITRHNPFNKTGGGDIASHAYLKAFSIISKGEIDICMASHIIDTDPDIMTRKIFRVPPRSIKDRCLSVITGETHRYTSFVKKILKNDYDYDLCVFDHSSISGTLVEFVNQKNIKTITIHHNFEADYFMDNSTHLEKALFLKYVIRNEKNAYIHSDYNLFLSEYDKNKFKMQYGVNNARNATIGVFNYFDEELIQNETTNMNQKLTFAITGTMSNRQTVDGVVDYLKYYHKKLPQNSSLIIAGRNPSREIYQLASKYDNVKIISNPKNIQNILRNANIYICPIKLGSGVKLRVLDAIKAGLPTLCNIVSSRGYELFAGKGVFIYQNEEEFTQQLNLLLFNLKEHIFSAKTLREGYDNTFTFGSGLKRVQKIFRNESNKHDIVT